VNRDMLMKANIQDLITLLDKKCNQDEVTMDINWLKNNLTKYQKEVKLEREQQEAVNEALCSENCVARFIWKQGITDCSPQGVSNCVKWDLQSVNTCPENFIWKQGSTMLQIDAPGLYEITLAFFSKKRKPLI
jgi:hypothetical protein